MSSEQTIQGGFKVGKYYRHSGGSVMHVIGGLKTTLYGWTLVAEQHGNADLTTVGQDEANTVNWSEISEAEWMAGFPE